MKYWQQEDTGRYCQCENKPSERWFEVSELSYRFPELQSRLIYCLNKIKSNLLLTQEFVMYDIEFMDEIDDLIEELETI